MEWGGGLLRAGSIKRWRIEVTELAVATWWIGCEGLVLGLWWWWIGGCLECCNFLMIMMLRVKFVIQISNFPASV